MFQPSWAPIHYGGDLTVPKTISEDTELLSTADVAKQQNVHRSTVWLWIKRGMLKSTRHGAFHGVKPSELKRFLSIYEPPPPSKKRKRKRKKKGKKS